MVLKCHLVISKYIDNVCKCHIKIKLTVLYLILAKGDIEKACARDHKIEIQSYIFTLAEQKRKAVPKRGSFFPLSKFCPPLLWFFALILELS